MSTKIQWCSETWNPIVGCSRISEGCKNCYAAAAAKSPRLQQFSQYQKVAKWDGTVELVESQLLKPLSWRSPKRIFACSMADIFHKNVLDKWIDKILAVVALCPQHTFQILTKRPERMAEYFNTRHRSTTIAHEAYKIQHGEEQYRENWNSLLLALSEYPLKNLWLGTSVENQKAANDRIPYLVNTPAAVRFLSLEPLLEAVDLSKWLPIEWSEVAEDWIEAWPGVQAYEKKLHQLIIGGESGKGARECHVDWVRSLVSQGQAAKIAVFVKQLGSKSIDSTCYIKGVVPTHFLLNLPGKGGEIDYFPFDLRIREFPK